MKHWDNKIDFCIGRHASTNHMYDKYLPYEWHLRMVVQVAKDYMHLVGPLFIDTDQRMPDTDITKQVIEWACWGHDLIEDTRASFNDVREALGIHAANIVYAVTNEKGRNRAERGNEKYYEGIRNTKGAQFVKMCDRIANVQHSKLTKSRMYDMYKNENEGFLSKIQCPYPEMVTYLKSLFDES